MKKIFTLPTWQVFFLLICPCFFPSNTLVGNLLMIIWAFFTAYCVFLLGEGLYLRLPVSRGLNINRFRFNIIFSLVYLTIVFGFSHGGYNINENNYKEYGWWLVIIIPAHLYLMYCLVFTFWFIAKSLATIENNREVSFGDYVGNFFLLFFYPIGIWFVHPKVRKLFTLDTESRSTV
jgi:hypothetical protein